MVEHIAAQGLLVTLTKKSIKDGCMSKSRVGKVQTLTLGQDVKIGSPLIKKEVPIYRRTPKFRPATTTVLGIKVEEEKKFTIETKTSFYELEIAH